MHFFLINIFYNITIFSVFYPNVLALDEELWHPDGLVVHPLPHLLLVLHAHEDIPLLELNKQGAQDLLDVGALGIRFPDDSHAGGVQNHLPQVLFHVVLQLNRGKT